MQPVITPRWKARRIGRLARVGLVLVACLLLAVYGIAAGLDPYEPTGLPRRQGTHEQLGLAACRFQLLTGKPCPSCGMTTAFSLLMHGDLPAAARANLAGLLLALAGWPLLVLCLLHAAAGRWWWLPRDLHLMLAGCGFFSLLLLAWGLKLLVG